MAGKYSPPPGFEHGLHQPVPHPEALGAREALHLAYQPEVEFVGLLNHGRQGRRGMIGLVLGLDMASFFQNFSSGASPQTPWEPLPRH